MSRRVVITGMGAITPVGNTVDEFWSNIKKGVVGIGPMTQIDPADYKAKLAAEVKDFEPKDYMDPKSARRMERFAQFAVAAAKQEYKKLLDKGPNRVAPLMIPSLISNMAAGNIAIQLGLKGKNINIVTACATGNHNIGEGFRSVQYGEADVMIAGGAEAAITELGVSGFTNMTALSLATDPKKASIPFDVNRSGFVMGEGAGIIVLEELEHAKKRGAKIYAEVIGYGATNDAFHITSPAEDGSGAAKAMEFAMKDAGVKPEDIDYINAHGTSTHMNDLFETRAVKLAMGDAAYKCKISSTKSMVGHLLGAAGGVETIACVKSIMDHYVHVNAGLTEQDPECDLDCVKGEGIEMDVNIALSNSLGFGGHNATLIFKAYNE